MRIALPLTSLLVGALSCACPAASDSGGTTPSGGSPSPSPAPAPAPSPEPAPAPGDGARAAAVPSSHPQYARVEGTSFPNGCASDGQCYVGGCSSEVCSAEQGVSSTCEAPADGWASQGATCGCVQGQCVWYKSGSAGGGSEPAPDPGSAAPAQGQTCAPDGSCAKGLTCVKYYGVAGPRGPEMTSCEIRCSGKGSCPKGQTCVTIADGPGQVCRSPQ